MKRLAIDGFFIGVFILLLMRLTGSLPLPGDQATFYEFTGGFTRLIKGRG